MYKEVGMQYSEKKQVDIVVPVDGKDLRLLLIQEFTCIIGFLSDTGTSEYSIYDEPEKW